MALVGVSAAVASSTMTIRSTNNATYGRILEGPAGYTLYVFCVGTQTVCTGHSGSSWTPLWATGTPVPASGSKLSAKHLGTRTLNGKKQVTYYRQPLYLYKGDKKPGQTNGENKYSGNGSWFVISNGGRAIPPPGY
jgi:predicted lipoprotein with Yx(FWY)xxD motif